MQNVIVSVGMGLGQVEFIRYLKKQGFSVAAFGKGENAQEAIELVDYYAEIDTKDAEGAIRWLDSLGVNVVAIGSYAGGGAVYTVQKLSTYYNTPTRLPQEVMVGNDKKEQQKFCERYNLSSILTWMGDEISAEDVERCTFNEYILKPKKGRGSEGIHYLTKEELICWIRNRDKSTLDCVIQSVCRGNEYRCALIVQDGKIKMLAPILRKSYKDTVFLGVLKYTEREVEKLQFFFEEFVNKAGIKNSIIKTDVIVSNNRVDVIEMDIGVGGGGYYKTFLSRIYGRDLMADYVRLITGRPVVEYKVCNPNLRMDYVFNHSSQKVSYDLQHCIKELGSVLGKCEILTNRLHPENKGGFASNADFIFTVIYEDGERVNSEFFVDEFVNEHLLYGTE